MRSPVFVGRREEIGLLTGWLDEAAAGRPRVVVIAGEAGVGKSRLVEELTRVAADHGARSLIGAAADYGEGGLPFGAIADALRSAGGTASILSRSADLVGSAPAAADGERASRVQAFERLLEALALLARERPLLLVLEDLHWADVSTREFLAFLSRNRGSMRLLTVATYRSDDVGRDHPLRRYLVELQRGQVEVIELHRFDRSELGEQLAAIQGSALDDRLIDALFARSQGNAFFSEELLASTAGGEPPSALPPTLRDTMLARVDRLTAGTQKLLAAAAVAGTADQPLLAAATQVSEDDVLAAVREAVERYVLEPLDGAAYGFRHALLRDAIYEDLLAAERSQLHQRIATALASRAGAEGAEAALLARLAHHWEHAGQPREAFVAAWRAAQAADRVYAKPEASRLFERVSALWPSVPDAATLLAGELARGDDATSPADRARPMEYAAQSAASFDLHVAVRLARKAFGYMDQQPDPDRAIVILEHIATWSREVGLSEPALEADGLMNSFMADASPAIRARILQYRSDAWIVFGDFEQARQQAQEAVAAAEQLGRTPELLRALILAARANGYCGRPDEAAVLFDRVRSLAADARMPTFAAEADRWQGDLYQAGGRFDEAVRLLRTAAARLDAVGESNDARHSLVICAQALQRAGHWAEAATELQRQLSEPEIHWARVLWAYLLACQGDFERATAELERATEFTFLSRNTGSLGPYYSARAEVALWQSRPAQAVTAAEEGLLAVADDLRWVGDLSVLGLRAAVEIGGAARPQAEQIMANLKKRAEHGLAGHTIFEPEVRAALASADAEMSRLNGTPDPDLFAAAASAWLAIPEPYPAAYALFRHAEALRPSDQPGAAKPLRQAVEIARRLGAKPLLEAAESLARRARIDVGAEPSPAATDYGLTAREREVLALVASGRSDREIAEALYISPKTASVHVSNVKGKLGVERRIEAAAIGQRLGLANRAS